MPKNKVQWDVTYPIAISGGVATKISRVEAHTVGEARAAAKRLMGIPKKGRLPVGARARRVQG